MVFDKYFSLPAALARQRSAPVAKERERFLAHLEATGTGRSAIRIAATYLLQVVNILGLRRLRDVTLATATHLHESGRLLHRTNGPNATVACLAIAPGPFRIRGCRCRLSSGDLRRIA